MGDLPNIYKIYYKVFTKNNFQDFEFSVKVLKVRNRLKDGGYSFYNDDGDTVKIEKKMLGGVFLQYALEEKEPYVEAYFIEDDKDLYELISNIIPPQDEEETNYLTKLEEGLREIVNDGLVNLIESVKQQAEYISEKEENVEEKNDN